MMGATRVDPLTPDERSERMRRVRSRDTKPELLVRRLVHGMGYRYRLSDPSLPGKPDLVFRSKKKVVFVHGCFWHQHGCGNYKMPKTRLDFWLPKLASNKARDERVRKELLELGWEVLVIWECETRGDPSKLAEKIASFLGGNR